MENDWEEHWDKMYGTWAWKTWEPRIRHAYNYLLSGTSLKNPSIVELGSGSGTNSLNLALALHSRQVTLIDSNKQALELSRKVFRKKTKSIKLKPLKKDILKLKMKEKFDIVHSEGVIEHFEGKERKEMFARHAELCKKGGFVIVFVPSNTLSYRLFKAAYQIAGKWIWEEKPFSMQELRKSIENQGLKVVKEYNLPFIHEIGIIAQKC